MKFSITKAAVAAAAIMLGTALPASAITNPTLLYSFENPPGDPNGPLDGFFANTASPGDTTLSQSTIGATNGSNSLLFSQNSTATFTAFQNATIPEAFNDPATTAISLDVTVPAGGQFTGTFANLGISEFAVDNDQSLYGATVFNFQTQGKEQNVSLSPGTHRVVVFLVYQYNPNTFDFGPNMAGVPFSSLMGNPADPEQFTPSSFEFWVNKGGTVNAPLNLYVDNIQAITASGWNTDASGDWNTNDNWYGGTPNAIGADAEFIVPVGATNNDTINMASPVTVGLLHFNNFNPHTLSGTGSLTLQAATGSASVVVDEPAAETISVPLIVASNTALNVAGGGVVTISGPVTVNSNMSLTPTGAGLITYSSSITLQSNAAITFTNFTTPQSLSLTTGSTATIAAHGSGPVDLLELNTLSFGGTSNNWLGKLDINDNTLIVHNTSSTAATTELGQLTNQIREGFTNNWQGTAGITSSVAAAHNNTAVGIELNDNGSGGTLFSTFEGQTVTNTDILIAYTYFGDANLDGVVNSADYLQIDNGFNSRNAAIPLTGWRNGDFNYDGVINGDDYTLLDNAFNTQGSVVLNATPAAPLAVNTSQIAAVPEPATLTLLGFGAAAFLTRRRAKIRT
jgi:Dockerin type I domain/PEP-CTERM motif